MESNGVMQEIRELLTSGKTALEVITDGFSSSTTYKCQKQLRRQGFGRGSPRGEVLVHQEVVSPMLRQEVERLQDQLGRALDAEEQALEQIEVDTAMIEHLHQHLKDLNQQVRELEPEAAAAERLRRENMDLLHEVADACQLRHQLSIAWRRLDEIKTPLLFDLMTRGSWWTEDLEARVAN